MRFQRLLAEQVHCPKGSTLCDLPSKTAVPQPTDQSPPIAREVGCEISALRPGQLGAHLFDFLEQVLLYPDAGPARRFAEFARVDELSRFLHIVPLEYGHILLGVLRGVQKTATFRTALPTHEEPATSRKPTRWTDVFLRLPGHLT